MQKPRKINWKRLCTEKEADILALRNQVDYLIRTIRDMDDKLFSISQCTSWPQMRPRISALVDEMTARKVAESKRISSLITRELHDTYKDESAALKQIGNK
jgi:hypothetical protein